MSILTSTTRTANPERTTRAETAELPVEALAHEHSRVTRRRIAIVAGLIAVALAAFVVSVIVGAIDLTTGQVLRGMVDPGGVDKQTRTVLWLSLIHI